MDRGETAEKCNKMKDITREIKTCKSTFQNNRREVVMIAMLRNSHTPNPSIRHGYLIERKKQNKMCHVR